MLLNDPDATVRMFAVESLPRVGNEDAIDLARASLGDPKRKVRRAARRSLEDLEQHRAA
jgi:HEAT repeat protein